MAENKYKSSTKIGKSGIFQYTAGNIFKAVMGGSTESIIGAKTVAIAGIENKIVIGASNSFKLSADLSLAYGKSFSQKEGGNIGYSKSSISISEYAGARCLDLFQASAGLGDIERGAFKAQKTTVNVAIRTMLLCDIVTLLGTLALAGVGTGFQDRAVDNNKDETTKNTVVGVTSGLTTLASLVPVIVTLARAWLSSKESKTDPKHWNPTSVLQASSSKGVFIGAHNGESGVRSSFIQNSEGTEWLVFKKTEASTYTTEPIVGSKLKTNQCITGFDSTGATDMTLFQLTESKATLNTKKLKLEGKAEVPGVHTGTGMTAVFQDVKLTATGIPNGAGPPNAELSLAGTSPSAKLIASAPGGSGASSSVEAKPSSLELKSGPSTMLKLNSRIGYLSAQYVNLRGSEIVLIKSMGVKISSKADTTIDGKVIRLG